MIGFGADAYFRRQYLRNVYLNRGCLGFQILLLRRIANDDWKEDEDEVLIVIFGWPEKYLAKLESKDYVTFQILRMVKNMTVISVIVLFQ